MNIPNALSMIRLALVPVFVMVYFSDLPNAHRLAGLVFVCAAFTDMLDGIIARKFNMITRLGRLLDPLADKTMTAAALVCVIIEGIIPLWVFIVFAAKEVLMGVGTIVMYKRAKDVMPSNIVGKIATTLFFASCLVLMIFEIPKLAATIMISAALLLTMVALVVYGIQVYGLIFKKDEQQKP